MLFRETTWYVIEVSDIFPTELLLRMVDIGVHCHMLLPNGSLFQHYLAVCECTGVFLWARLQGQWVHACIYGQMEIWHIQWYLIVQTKWCHFHDNFSYFEIIWYLYQPSSPWRLPGVTWKSCTCLHQVDRVTITRRQVNHENYAMLFKLWDDLIGFVLDQMKFAKVLMCGTCIKGIAIVLCMSNGKWCHCIEFLQQTI